MTMQVALDATPVISGWTGISIYVSELVAALQARGVTPRLFAVGRAVAPVPPGCKRFPVPARIVHRSWARGGPPLAEWITGPVDVVHSTGLLPPSTRKPVVATVHDLVALDHPTLHTRRLVAQTEALVRHLDRVAVIIVDSVATSVTLERRGVSKDRIAVAYPGLPRLPAPKPERVIDAHFLLAVGEQMPRKGLRTLLEAFAVADLDDLLLVHAGPESSQTRELFAFTEELGVAERVRWLGFVSREQLAALYRDAVALCYPSVAEGFGFPVLEAMACGTPVIASDIPPVREVAGDAALLVPVGDVGAWANAVQQVLRDAVLRERMTSVGAERAACFNWHNCAASIVEAYGRALDHA